MSLSVALVLCRTTEGRRLCRNSGGPPGVPPADEVGHSRHALASPVQIPRPSLFSHADLGLQSGLDPENRIDPLSIIGPDPVAQVA